MEIVLPPEIEASVLERSSEEGRSPEVLVAECLSRAFRSRSAAANATQPSSLAELLAAWIGCLDSGEARQQRTDDIVAALRGKREAGRL